MGGRIGKNPPFKALLEGDKLATVTRAELELMYRDFNAEPTSLTLTGAAPADGDFVADRTLATAVANAINAITDGVQNRFAYTPGATIQRPRVRSTSQHSMKEKVWVFHYMDSVTGLPYTKTLGTADTGVAGLLLPGTNQVDPASAEFTALKTAWDAWVTHPDTGNATELIKVEIEGRLE